MAAGAWVGGAEAGGVGGEVVGLLLGLALGLDALVVVVDLPLAGLVVPAQHDTHLARDPLGCGEAAVEGLDGDARAPGEDVVEVQGALAQRRVARFGA